MLARAYGTSSAIFDRCLPPLSRNALSLLAVSFALGSLASAEPLPLEFEVDYWPAGPDRGGLNLDSNGDFLAISGDFRWVGGTYSPGFALWNGEDWFRLEGTKYSPLEIRSSAWFEGQIAAAGEFESHSGDVVDMLAIWTGEDWNPLWMQAGVRSLYEWEGELIATGVFGGGDAWGLESIARYDDGVWLPMGNGLSDLPRDFAVLAGDLVAVGRFELPGGGVAGVVRWDGNEWAEVGDGSPTGTWSVASFRESLVVGGLLTDDEGTYRLATYDGVKWSRLADGLPIVGETSIVSDLVNFGEDLFIVGDVHTASDEKVFVGRWDGTRLHKSPDSHYWRTAVVYDDRLVVQGSSVSTYLGGPADNLAIGLPGAWEPLTAPRAPNGAVRTMLRWGDGLLIGGSFTNVGTVPANGVAILGANGETQPVGEGLLGNVADLIRFEDRIVACGAFTTSPDTEPIAMAAWDGHSWVPWIVPLDGPVLELLPYGNDLIAVGAFGFSPPEFNGVARWDGSSWNAMGDGFDWPPTNLATDGESVYVGGAFVSSGDDPVPSVARWDGQRWVPLGRGPASGPVTSVSDMAFYDSRLFVSGDFPTSDGLGDGFAIWNGDTWSGRSDIARPSSFLVNEDRLWMLSRQNLWVWDGIEMEHFTLDAQGDPEDFELVDGVMTIGGEFLGVSGLPSRFLARVRSEVFPIPPTDSTALQIRAQPSPFRDSLRFGFDVSQLGPHRLVIHDVSGRVVHSQDLDVRRLGRFTTAWDGTVGGNRAVPSGAYFAKLTTPSGSASTRILHIR